MRLFVAGFLLLAFSISALADERILIIDTWWTVDYARQGCNQAKQFEKNYKETLRTISCEELTACPEMQPRIAACLTDKTGGANYYLDRLKGRLAASPECAGITVASFVGPSNGSPAVSNLMKKPHKTLIIDYVPGEPRQYWGVTDETNTILQGEGSLSQLVVDVCRIVKTSGAKVVH